MKNFLWAAAAAVLLSLGAAGPAAADAAEGANRIQADLTLSELIAAQSGAGERRFIAHAQAPARLVGGGVTANDLDYAAFLAVLRNNGLSVVDAGGVTSIVRTATVRQHPLPVVDGTDAPYEDDTWVSGVIGLRHAEASGLVPILRPLLPQAGHLAAVKSTNLLLIVDRYGNYKRLRRLIEQLDRRPRTQAD